MTDNTEYRFNLTAPVVLAFPSILEPRKFKRNGKESGEAKYGGMFVFELDSADLKDMKAKAAQIARARWPSRPLGELLFPFRDGNKEADKRVEKLRKEGKADDGKGDFQRGKVVMKASSNFRPTLAAIVNGKILEVDDANLAQHKGKFYFGVEVLAQFTFKPYDKIRDGDKDGVTAYLNMVLTTGKGQKLAGGPSAQEVFSKYVGTVSTENPTSGTLDGDEIPF